MSSRPQSGLLAQGATQWDEPTHTPYTSIDAPGAAGDTFITYENERSLTDKLRYARESGLGALMLWDINGDFTAAAVRHPLQQAMKQALRK